MATTSLMSDRLFGNSLEHLKLNSNIDDRIVCVAITSSITDFQQIIKPKKFEPNIHHHTQKTHTCKPKKRTKSFKPTLRNSENFVEFLGIYKNFPQKKKTHKI